MVSFSFVTTTNFDYDGNKDVTFQIPAFNVGWKSALKPHDEKVKSGSDIAFSWATAPNVKSYNVLVKDADRNDFYKTGELTDTKWTWAAANQKGNQGNMKDKALEKGKTYYYLVNVTFDQAGADPKLAYGGSALAKFTVE